MKSSRKLVIVGIGETATLAFEYFTRDSEYEVVAFAVDAEYISDPEFRGLPIVPLGALSMLYPPAEYEVFVAMGSGELNYRRSRMFRRVKSAGYRCASYISSHAFVWGNVSVGENCFILEDNTLQPFTEVGDDVVMWSGNHLGHRSKIGDHCFITSHVVISGYCRVGHHTFMGVNSCLADGVHVGPDNFIAMGACLGRDTPENVLSRGNPASKARISARVFCNVNEND